MRSLQRYFGPVSIAILLLITALAFVNFQGTSSPPPAILDPDFTLWTQTGNFTQPLVWSLGSNVGREHLMLERVTLLDRNAVRISIYQNGAGSNDSYVTLAETLDGERLAHLMNSTVGIWVFKDPCECDSNQLGNASELQAVQVNDGIRTISFVFTDKLQGSATFLGHRLVLIPTPSNQWSYEEVNIGREYAAANWLPPNSLTFTLLFEVRRASVGWHSVYFSQITAQANSQAALTGVVQISAVSASNFYQMFKVQENVAGAE